MNFTILFDIQYHLTGEVTVFVINHGPTYYYNESVEVFRYNDEDHALHYLRTIRDTHFVR